MSRQVEFLVERTILNGCRDAAILLGGEDPLEAVIEQAIDGIATDINLTIGGIKMHLAAWKDPDHWSDDWAEKGIDADDVAELVSGAIQERA